MPKKALSRKNITNSFKSKRNQVLIIAILTSLASPSLTQVFTKETFDAQEKQKTNQEQVTKDTLITLNNYPKFELSAGSERSTLRNPFTSQTAAANEQGILTAPLIIVKGFGSDEYEDTVFINVNNSFDNIFTIGQQVGNGYRISKILPDKGEIEISNGNKRIRHKVEEH